jgi:hypothetical protein
MTTMTKRVAPFCRTIALLAQVFVFQGCGGSNNGNMGTGGTASQGTGGTGTATGGVPGTGGSVSSTGGTTGTGGTGTSTGGAGGAATTGFGQPACGNTMEGVAIAKGGTCTAADAAGGPTALCYKTCGPEKAGVKSETCPAGGGTYAEMTGCSFDPSKDYSCYKIPATPDATCPTTAIMAGSACTISDCVVCGGTTGYTDSTGAAKTGYCVCQAAASAPTWSCASSTAWPCPNGSGC